MNAFIQACLDANKEIYEYLNTHISSSDYNYSDTIGVGGDNSLNIDLICEDIFIKHLLSFGNIYSEEKGHIQSDVKNKIIIDPLDGSANFQAGLAYYGTSVALEVNDKVICSVICNLANHSVIYKFRDENIMEIDLLTKKKVSNLRENSTNLAIFERAYSYPNIAKTLEKHSVKFRSPGVVAISKAEARN